MAFSLFKTADSTFKLVELPTVSQNDLKGKSTYVGEWNVITDGKDQIIGFWIMSSEDSLSDFGIDHRYQGTSIIRLLASEVEKKESWPCLPMWAVMVEQKQFLILDGFLNSVKEGDLNPAIKIAVEKTEDDCE